MVYARLLLTFARMFLCGLIGRPFRWTPRAIEDMRWLADQAEAENLPGLAQRVRAKVGRSH